MTSGDLFTRHLEENKTLDGNDTVWRIPLETNKGGQMKNTLDFSTFNIMRRLSLGMFLFLAHAFQTCGDEKSNLPQGAVLSSVSGTYYSLTLMQPPFPFNPFPDLPVSTIRKGVYVYDDRSVDYLALRAELAAAKAASASLSLASEEGGFGGGGMMMLMSAGETNLGLTIPVIQNNTVSLSIVNANTNEHYDMFATATVGTTNAWTYLGRLTPGNTNVSVALQTGGAANAVAFNTANTYDSDGDSLSDAIENMVTQTNPNSADSPEDHPPGHPAQPFLVDAPPSYYVKSVASEYWDKEILMPSGHIDGPFSVASWARGIGGTGSNGWYTGYPSFRYASDTISWNGNGSATPDHLAPMPPYPSFFRIWSEHYDFSSVIYDVHDNVATGLELSTGGRPASTGQSLFVLSVAVDRYDGYPPTYTYQGPVPRSSITLLGAHPDSQNQVWKKLPDNQKIDITPQATPEYTNYSMNVSATKLKIWLAGNGQDITGKHAVAWVGEKISLGLGISDPAYTASNFVWSIGGNTISNYVYTSTNAFVVADYPKTNTGVSFYWIDKSESAAVSVTAMIGGISISAEATFEVRRPEAIWRLTPKWYVEVSTNYQGYAEDGYPRLLTGRMFSTNDVGMIYEFILSDLKGYTRPYEFQFVQVVTLDAKYNLPQSGGQYFSKEKQMRGLDGGYPYKTWGSPNQYGMADDTPSHLLDPDFHVFVYRYDQFESYLMWRPYGGIPVPLRVANWEWKGKAQYNGINGSWTGLTPYVHPQGSIGADTIVHPSWTNNAGNSDAFWKYNNFWFNP